MKMGQIPPKLIIDTTTIAEGQKITFIKGLRNYASLTLQEAKTIAESGNRDVKVVRSASEELAIAGIEGIKSSGATIVNDSVRDIVNLLEQASKIAIDGGFYPLAGDIVNVLKGMK